MKTKVVSTTESLELIPNNTFVFCNELAKGFIKRDLSPLNITDYNYTSVANAIEALTFDECILYGLDQVEFVNGEEKISHKVNKFIEEVVSTLPPTTTAVQLEQLFTNHRIQADYFNDHILTDAINALSLTKADIIGQSVITMTHTDSSQTYCRAREDEYDYRLVSSTNQRKPEGFFKFPTAIKSSTKIVLTTTFNHYVTSLNIGFINSYGRYMLFNAHYTGTITVEYDKENNICTVNGNSNPYSNTINPSPSNTNSLAGDIFMYVWVRGDTNKTMNFSQQIVSVSKL